MPTGANPAGTNLLLQSNAFAACAPNIATNIAECGSVTLCNARPLTAANLSQFLKSTDYAVMGALFKHDLEIKMCEAKQNGLYDFFMSNKVNMSKRLATEQLDEMLRVRPFVFAKQYSQINDQYYLVSGVSLIAGTSNIQCTVSTTTNIPADTRNFPVDQRVIIDGSNAGTRTVTQWQVVSSTLIGNGIFLVLSPQNSGSNMPASKLATPTSGGILMRGTANKSDYERFCAEPAAYLNWKYVPFWIETQRNSMCSSERYEQFRKLLLSPEGNDLFREFGDLPEAERNRQLGVDWQNRLLNMMFWGKPINANQTVTAYDQLDDIFSYFGGNFDTGASGKCVGKRANMVGIYEQLSACGRVYDAQGAQLYLLSVFAELYNMKRIREGSEGGKARVEQFDLFTDTITANFINQAMISYYNTVSGNSMRLNLDVQSTKNTTGFNPDQEIQKGEFGFNWRSYNLFYPAVRINVISHYYFDDYLTAKTFAGQSNGGRFLWILDMAGIYPGVIATNRRVNKSGDLATLAKIDKDWMCVMQTDWQEQTLNSVTMTMVVECPMGNLIIENFASGLPDAATQPPALGGAAPTYPATTTTTTTTSTTPSNPWYNTQQEFTATCPSGTVGESQTAIIAPGLFSSLVSQADANNQALVAATNAANDALHCV